MRDWPEVLTELERIDFELARAACSDVAGRWMEQRSGVMNEMSGLPVSRAGRQELVRLAHAAARGRELESTWQIQKTQMRLEAEDLYAAQLLLKSVAPERRGLHFSFES